MKELSRSTRFAMIIVAAAGLVLLARGGAEATGISFFVNEGAVPGAEANTFTADELTGKYQEALVLDPGGFFSASLLVYLTGYVNGGFPIANTQVGPGGSGEVANANLYSLYALVTMSGSYSQTLMTSGDADPGNDVLVLTFHPSVAMATIYVDPLRDTASDYANGTTTSGGDDDKAVVTASTIHASSTGDMTLVASTGQLVDGSISLLFTNPTLVDGGVGIGPAYWPSLSSFSMTLTGDVDPGGGFPTNVTGDGAIVLQEAVVPEPASVTLLTLGLAGLWARRWRAHRQQP